MILKNHLICGFPSQVILKTGRSPHSFASLSRTLYLAFVPLKIISSCSSEGKSKCISELAKILKLFGVQLSFLNQEGSYLFPSGIAKIIIFFPLRPAGSSQLCSLNVIFSVSPGMVCREIR